MTTQLTEKKDLQQVIFDEPALKEYSIVIDGVIEMPDVPGEKLFFDGLLDTLIEYVEKHGAFAGLSMTHKEYLHEDNGETDGDKAT